MDCIFCKIIGGEIPSNKIYEDENIFAFRDIAPQAPVHALIVPKKHIAGVDELNAGNIRAVSAIFEKIPQIAKDLGLENGYRVISNVGKDGCQSVRHLHFHLLGGAPLSEKMC